MESIYPYSSSILEFLLSRQRERNKKDREHCQRELTKLIKKEDKRKGLMVPKKEILGQIEK